VSWKKWRFLQGEIGEWLIASRNWIYVYIYIYTLHIYIYMYAYIHIVIHPSKMGFNHHVGELIEINIMGVPQKWI
jgi:hypothetical protein